MPLLILPVIDLMDGVVVRARAGERDSYAPLTSSVLCRSADPIEVVRGYLRLHPFVALYLADLDAIRGRPPQRQVLQALAQAFPDVCFWVDAGFAAAETVDEFLETTAAICVLGSESQSDTRLVERYRDHARVVLSLDLRGEQRLGPPELFERPELWPRRVIVMTLARVGTGGGPDLEVLRQMRALAPNKLLFAAGGVRDAQDLHALAALGCAGVLVASALHDGRIDARELEALPDATTPRTHRGGA